MMKGKKPTTRAGGSPVVPKEAPEKTPKAKVRSYSRPSIKERTSSQTRSKSRSRKTAEPKPRGRSVSRSRSRSKTKVSKSRGRSRSRSRSRSRKGTMTSSRSRSRSRKGTMTRSRARSRSKVEKKNDALNDLVDIVEKRALNLVLKNVLHDDFTTNDSKLDEIVRRSLPRDISQEEKAVNTYKIPSHTIPMKLHKDVEPIIERTIERNIIRDEYVPIQKESKLNEIIRRSVSRELSQSKANMYVPSNILKNRKETSEPKIMDKIKEKPESAPLRKRKSFKVSIPDWFLAVFGLTVTPLLILSLHLACNRNQCNLSKFQLPKNWEHYISLEAMEIVVGLVVVQALLCMLPIGKRVDGPPGINGSLQYRCNGLLSTFLSVGIVAGLWHYKFPVTIVYDRLISLLVSSTILGFLLGLVLFIKGRRAPVPALNPDGILGSYLHKFFVGQEINPVLFGKINVKTLLLRLCFNGMLLINGLLALKAYEVKNELTNTLMACIVLNSLLVVDFFWFEDSFPSTFQAMYEGCGCYLTLHYCLYPFMMALITKFIIQHKIDLPVYVLVAIVIAFTVGFVVHRASNLQKAAFRKSPLANTVFAKFETISTMWGKKLLVAGWWGWVRHPNYLGTIILHWAWASTSGYSHVIPYAVPLIITIMLMVRARRVDSFCSQRYQTAWDEYCNRVRYRILPLAY